MEDRGPAHTGPPAPSAPWRLLGQCVLAWARSPRDAGALLPEGLHPLPGPAAIVGVRYEQSPVGPYLELSVAVPARMGLRPGLCVVRQAVSSPDAARAYRVNWGLPTRVGTLSWAAVEDGAKGEVEIRNDDEGLRLRGAPFGPPIPSLVPARSLQRRSDGPVVLPRRLVSLMRLARTTVLVADDVDDPLLVPLVGVHPGAVMSGVRILAAPARTPLGLWSSLRAPLQPAEPVFAREVPRHPLQLPPARALSSVG